MALPVIIQTTSDSNIGYMGYGAAREFWRSKDAEIILSGPYETGKTIAALNKLHALLCKYAGAQALMVRKTYKSLIASVVVSYEKKILPFPPGHPKCLIAKYGGEHPEWYDYPNGSRLYLGGMDKPDKFLSAEFDFIYVNQAEELRLDDWEKLSGRATGRAGNTPYPQIMADCNPGAPHHWIKQRPQIRLLKSKHRDNPTLYHPETGEITEQGKRTMAKLNALTGVRLKRGRDGLWVGAEGQVYEEWDEDIHVIDPFKIPPTWTRYRAIDFGYRNPFVCGWWATDEDGRLYLYRQLYMTGRTVKVHAEQINRLSASEKHAATIADHDAGDRATLEENGISTIAAKKDISVGIEKVQERLKVQGDGRPRLFIFRDSLVEEDMFLKENYKPTCAEQEFSNYVYPEPKDKKPEKEAPIDADNHGMDMIRYMVMYLDGGQRKVAITKSPDKLAEYRG